MNSLKQLIFNFLSDELPVSLSPLDSERQGATRLPLSLSLVLLLMPFHTHRGRGAGDHSCSSFSFARGWKYWSTSASVTSARLDGCHLGSRVLRISTEVREDR